jgi:hypothetical protein
MKTRPRRKPTPEGSPKILFLPSHLENVQIRFLPMRELVRLGRIGGCDVVYDKNNQPTGCKNVGCTGTCSGPDVVSFLDSSGIWHTYYVCRCG